MWSTHSGLCPTRHVTGNEGRGSLVLECAGDARPPDIRDANRDVPFAAFVGEQEADGVVPKHVVIGAIIRGEAHSSHVIDERLDLNDTEVMVANS